VTAISFFSWSNIDYLADRLAEHIRAAEYKPACIVAIGRGGMIPARLLSDRLGVKKLRFIAASRYRAIGEPGETYLGSLEQFAFQVDERLLLVDDIVDSGETFQAVLARIPAPGRVTTAALILKNGTSFTPEFYGTKVGPEWISFPWERDETNRESSVETSGDEYSSNPSTTTP
jgi:uncharacterized protein